MRKRIAPRRTWRAALSVGLCACFLVSAVSAAAHIHVGVGAKIQGECRLCLSAGLRKALAPEVCPLAPPPLFWDLARPRPEERVVLLPAPATQSRAPPRLSTQALPT